MKENIIDEAFLLDLFKVEVVEDDPEFAYWRTTFEASSSFVEGFGIDWKVIDFCREVNRIPGVLTHSSCVGRQVHKIRNELIDGTPKGCGPYIQFSVIGETGLMISKDTLDKFNDLPHRVYFRELSDAVNSENIPFEFNGRDRRDKNSTCQFRGNSPVLEIIADYSAEDVIAAWDFMTEFTKKFNEKYELNKLTWLPKEHRGKNNPFDYLNKKDELCIVRIQTKPCIGVMGWDLERLSPLLKKAREQIPYFNFPFVALVKNEFPIVSSNFYCVESTGGGPTGRLNNKDIPKEISSLKDNYNTTTIFCSQVLRLPITGVVIFGKPNSFEDVVEDLSKKYKTKIYDLGV